MTATSPGRKATPTSESHGPFGALQGHFQTPEDVKTTILILCFYGSGMGSADAVPRVTVSATAGCRPATRTPTAGATRSRRPGATRSTSTRRAARARRPPPGAQAGHRHHHSAGPPGLPRARRDRRVPARAHRGGHARGTGLGPRPRPDRRTSPSHEPRSGEARTAARRPARYRRAPRVHHHPGSSDARRQPADALPGDRVQEADISFTETEEAKCALHARSGWCGQVHTATVRQPVRPRQLPSRPSRCHRPYKEDVLRRFRGRPAQLRAGSSGWGPAAPRSGRDAGSIAGRTTGASRLSAASGISRTRRLIASCPFPSRSACRSI
jgi:hypothetical protein